ncbi:MAG: LPS export ABC transporter periplasmic protein LptC [Candidatus Latescibacterota bacterium]|nr:MAG: LPS export ABC transporter periplasmic protein LptC [Candidatus Latescibacterota bacterium]
MAGQFPGWRVALLTLVAMVACERQEVPSTVDRSEVPVRITRGFTTTESDSGRVRFILKAAIARVYADDVTHAETIEVEFYEDGERASVLTADRGLLESGRVTATGNVVVETVQGTRLETESLYWDRSEEKIRSDEFVRITRKGDPQVLTGRGMSSPPNLEFIDIDDYKVEGPMDPESP